MKKLILVLVGTLIFVGCSNASRTKGGDEQDQKIVQAGTTDDSGKSCSDQIADLLALDLTTKDNYCKLMSGYIAGTKDSCGADFTAQEAAVVANLIKLFAKYVGVGTQPVCLPNLITLNNSNKTYDFLVPSAYGRDSTNVATLSCITIGTSQNALALFEAKTVAVLYAAAQCPGIDVDEDLLVAVTAGVVQSETSSTVSIDVIKKNIKKVIDLNDTTTLISTVLIDSSCSLLRCASHVCVNGACQ